MQHTGVFAQAQQEFPLCLEGLKRFDTLPRQAGAGRLEWTGDSGVQPDLDQPARSLRHGTRRHRSRRLPLGIQIVTRIGEDRQALAWAQWVAAAIAA